MTSNQIEYWKLQETKRANLAKEAETKRHDLEEERVKHLTYGEEVQHNRNVETETQRHNQAMDSYDLLSLAEGVRTHQENESIARSNVSLGYAELGEKQRHDTRSENLSAGSLKHDIAKDYLYLKEQKREFDRQSGINEARNSIEMVKAVLQGITGLARFAGE